MAAEVALQDPAIGGAVEDGAPGFELADAVGSFLGVELGHAPVVDVLAAAHGVGEVDLPVVAVIDVGQGGGDAALGHDGVGLAQQRLAHQADRDAGRGSFDGRAQPGAAGADDQDVVFVRFVVCHAQIILHVAPDAHGAQPHVQVAEAHPEETAPGPDHVAAVEAARRSRRRVCVPACRVS